MELNSVPSGVFDHQITPISAVIEYLDRDFRGLFEKSDLAVDERGIVVNRRFRTQHHHEFPNGIAASYDDARSRHDYLCSKLRNVISGDIPTLFVLRFASGDAAQIADIYSIIRQRNRKICFEIALLRTGTPPSRPKPDDWKGNDAEWARLVSDYSVRPYIADLVKQQARRFAKHIRQIKF